MCIRDRGNITSALSYPAFLIVFSVAVVVFVLVVIFPKFEVLFASIYDQLPITTIFLMALSAFVRHYWILIIIGLSVAGWAIMTWMKSSAGKLAFDQFKMRAPIIKDIYTQIYLSQTPVSYTHLDVYKRQMLSTLIKPCLARAIIRKCMMEKAIHTA